MKTILVIVLLIGVVVAQQLPPAAIAAAKRADAPRQELLRLAAIGCAYQLTPRQLGEMGTNGSVEYCRQKVEKLEVAHAQATAEYFKALLATPQAKAHLCK